MKTIGAALLALLAVTAAILAQTNGTAQQGPSIGVDADPSGNSATSLGTADSCVRVKKGDTFPVDVFIMDASDLLAWEAYFSFDGSVVNVTGRDVKLFLAADPNSDVFDASESLPSSGGLYRLAALDMGHPASPHSGSGVLASLTLKAVGAGISPALLVTTDVNNDGKPDLGTRLKNPGEKPLGDVNGDEFFDGPVFNAQIAVDRDCPTGPSQTATPSPAVSPAAGSATPTGAQTLTATATLTGTVVATTPVSPTPLATPTVSPAITSPTPRVSPSAEDEGTDWGSPALIAAYAGIGTVVVLAMGGLALFRTRRGRF